MNTFSGVNLAWPSTPADQTSVLSCPDTDGSATRKCSVEGVWEQPCVCDCLTCFHQLFCYIENPIRPLNKLVQSLLCTIGNSSNLQNDESRETVLDAVEVLLNASSDSVENASAVINGTIEQTITDSLSALVTNLPVGVGEYATITSSKGTVEIVLSRPDTFSDMGIQIESQGTTVKLPPALVMPIIDLGGGNVTVAVTTFSSDNGIFQPQDPLFSLDRNLVDISIVYGNEIFPASNLSVDMRIAFELPRINSFDDQSLLYCVFWNVTEQDWSSDGCEVINATANFVTCACNHLTTFGSLSVSSTPMSNASTSMEPTTEPLRLPTTTEPLPLTTEPLPSTTEIPLPSDTPLTTETPSPSVSVPETSVPSSPTPSSTVCPEESNTTSGITLTWPSTPVGETAVLSCPNTDRNATRRCTDGGVWGEPYVHECTNLATFSQSNVPEMTSSPAVLVEVTSSLSDVPEMTSSSSVLAEVTSSLSDIPEMTSSSSVLAEVTSSLSDVPVMTSSPSVLAEVTSSLSNVPEMTSSPSVLAEVTSSLSDVPEMTSSPSVLAEVTSSLSDVPEMTSSPSVLVEVTSSLSDVPEMTSSPSVLAEVTSSLSDVPERTSSQSVLAGVTSSVSDVTQSSSTTIDTVESLSISEISQMTSSSLLALLTPTPSQSETPSFSQIPTSTETVSETAVVIPTSTPMVPANCTVFSELTTLSTGSNNTIIDGISTTIQDMFGDGSSFFTLFDRNLLLFDVGILNARRLLPFGSQYGDSVFEFSYIDYYKYIYGVQYTLSRPLPFFGSDQSDLYVNFLGFVSIGQPYTNPWRRAIFPLTGTVPMVASFWWWEYSTIYIHEYSRGVGSAYEDAVISMVESRLHQYPQVNTTFRPEVILSVTWSLNFAYIKYTTQMLIVSNGIRTFSLVSYDEDNWFFAYWYSRYTFNDPVIGYSAGDGINFETLNVEFWELNVTMGNTGSPGVWIFPLFDTQDDQSAEEDCKAWYDSERLEGPVDFVNRSVLNSCPCTIEQARANWRAGWSRGFRYGSRENCTVLWWPRRTGWGWWGREPVGTVECCYDEFGSLLAGPRSGGTSKKYHFYYEVAQYVNLDLIPYQDCCVRSSKTELCNYYYELRKSDDCSFYDEALAQNWGDPHFDSFDGLGYTFNGKGEFWLVQTTDSSISIQVRLTPTVNGTATFISAAAIQFDGEVPANAYIKNDAIVVEISGQMFTREDVKNTTYVGSDGTVYDLDLMAGPNSINQLQNVSLILDQDDPGISISNVMGSLSVTVSLQAEGALSVSSDLSGSAFQDNTRGLLGVINGDTADDFTLPNGTLIDVNSTEEEIYYNFGLAWRVSESESIFVYKGSDTYTGVNDDTDFTPQFGVDLDNIPKDVRDSCGDNTQCLFDYQQTGNLELAMSTASEQERLNSVRTVLNTVPPSITGPRTIRVIAGQRFTTMYNSTGNMTLQFPTPQNLTLIDGVLLWNVPPSLVPEEAIRIMSTVPDGNATSTIMVSVVLCGCAEGGECIQVDMPNFGNGSYYQEQCRCAPAYEGRLCESDIDGCKENPCQDPSLCEDVPAPGVGFNCTGCLEGYQLSRNMCDDIDECSDTNACSGPSMCVNSDGSFQCVCNSGYMIQGTECIDIDECSEGSANCDQICVNNDGGFECQCETGFIEDPDSGNCIAIKSCELDCGAGECVTMEGVDVCVCPSGSSFDGQSCADCQSDRFGFNCSMICNCMNGGTCDNVRGCVCVPGWTGGNCSIVINDFNPTFDSNLQSMVAIIDRDPVDKIVITLTATDRDINSLANSVTYSTEDFTPQSSSMYEDGRPFFSLNSSNGEVRIQRQPDGDGPYLLIVLARDSAPIPRTSTPFLLVITVTSTFEEVLTLTVLENATIGTVVGRLQCSGLGDAQSVAVEEDVGNALEVFQLAVDGSVTVKSVLDYESVERYVFSINCTEGATTRFASVRISVTDVNDNSPNITGYSGLSLTVSENNNVGEILGSISVSDEDSEENGRISFHVDPPNTPVSINDNGEIVMTAVVNYENTNMYSFTVTAVDGGNPSRSSTPLSYTLTVQDANDAPQFGGTAYVTILPGYAEIVPSPLLNISVSDEDSGGYDWVNVSVDIPWLEINISRASQQVLLKRYPGDSLEVGSADYLQHADISPYLDGDQTPITQQSGQAVYLRGMLTTRDGGNLETSVPIFVIVFPTSALVRVTVATNRTVDGFRPQAITMAMVFEQSLIQRTIPFQGRPVYSFNMYSIEQSSAEDNSIQLYGFFHNSTLVSGPIDVAILPQNYHFLTESIVKDVLAEEYTRSEVARALGTSVEYSVEGTNVTAVPQPTDEPATLSVGVTVTIVISTFVATVVLTAGIGIVIFLLIKARKVGKKPVGTDASLASQPAALVMENYT